MELNDKLNYFKIGLSSGIIKPIQFGNWLNHAFIKADEDIYLELELCKNTGEIISCINQYHYKTGYDNNPDKAIKYILSIVKNKYKNNDWDLKQTAEKLSRIYACIDSKYILDEPYSIMSYVDEGIGTWAYDKDIEDRLESIFRYCD